MKSRLALLALVLAACAGAPSPPDGGPTITYEFAPAVAHGELTHLHVTLSLVGDSDGVTELELPISGMTAGEAASYIDALRFDGAQHVARTPASVAITHAPSAPLVVRYDLLSGYPGDPRQEPFKPVVRPDWFAAHGEAAFIRPVGRDRNPVSVVWTGFPSDWLAAWSAPANTTISMLPDVFVFGGADWRRIVTQVGDAPVAFYYRTPNWRVSPEGAIPLLTSVLASNFAYWNDPPRPLTIPVLQLSGGDFGGRGLASGFIIFAGAELDLRDFTPIFAHEHQHNWISRQVGGFPRTESNLSAWFNEGFADATSARSLLRGGIWQLEDFTADLNGALLRYHLSPEVEAPNRRIQEARGANVDVHWLAYDRGRLIAIMFDRRLRGQTNGAIGLDAVLQTQRRLAAENDARGIHTPANELLPVAAREVVGIDAWVDMARFVDGARIELPADLFAPCGQFEEATQPIFDRGFDLEATIQNGRRVTGLNPNGPAARAGLREGARIRISEIFSRDSQTRLTYRILDADGSERVISYKPEGHSRVRFQRFVLRDGMDEVARERCRLMLSGAV